MSEQAYDREFEDDEPPRPRRNRLAPLLLAAAILAVFVAVAWYALSNAGGVGGPQLAAFEPPLLKANPEPYKRKPEDPGGMRIPNQDKQVFERILPGPSPQQEERLLPKPEEPLARPEPPKPEPQAEDSSADGETVTSTVPEEEASPPSPADTATAAATETPTETASATSEPSTPAVADASAADAQPVAEAEGQPRIASDGTPMPMERPAQLAAIAPAAASTQAEAADMSGYRLQLAAFREHEQAITAWRRLKSKYVEHLGTLEAHIVSVDITGKGTFHRLQTGPFATEEAAQSTCQALKAREQDCLLVKPN